MNKNVHLLKSLISTFLLLSSFTLLAQDCSCTISEVESNTVSPCHKTIGSVVQVASTQEFQDAIRQANQSGGNMTILIEDGTYAVASTASYPYITASNMVIRSVSGNRDNVVLTGQGMMDVAPFTEIVLYLVGNNITVADLTLRDCGNHGIAITSDDHLIHNVKIQNTFEQMIKANDNGELNENSTIQCSLFEYTAGVGPQWYIGGLDIHGGHGFEVRDNVFRNINSPSQSLAEHAIHFWDNSANNLVERNKILNCDRGIGFGLGNSVNEGGIIRNNTIVNEGITPFHDVGIGLESSPNTEVYNNSILIAYPNAIEYRFTNTTNVTITNNLCNQAIRSRNGGSASVINNITDAQIDWFSDPYNGDLHLLSTNNTAVDRGISLPSVRDDIDQEQRPINGLPDIGADEYAQFLDEDMDGYTSDVDCNDNNADINPDATEVIYNGLDDDCNPETLDDDLDQDGFVLADDCNDNNADVNPDMMEIIYNGLDDDCDQATHDDDLDQDGFVLADDCDDNNADVNPDATEVIYNGWDDDCNPETLDDDLDQDGFVLADDCDDNNASIHPNAIEIIYNGWDDDCNPETRDDDIDQDGFVFAEDCDDNNGDVNPNANEVVYNGLDDDCDPITLDDDLDQDGFALADDCDDGNADINPNASEIPNNNIDEDCDGEDLVTSTFELSSVKIQLFPNPVSSSLTIQVHGNLSFEVVLFDLDGKLLKSAINPKNLDVQDLETGIYLLMLTDLKSSKKILEKIYVVR